MMFKISVGEVTLALFKRASLWFLGKGKGERMSKP